LEALVGLWKTQSAAPTLITFLLSWICILTAAVTSRITPAAQHPHQCRKIKKIICFYRKKLIAKSQEDSKKETICPELLQQAASSAPPF